MSKAKGKGGTGRGTGKKGGTAGRRVQKRRKMQSLIKAREQKMLISRKATNPICAVSSATSTYSA